VAPGFGDGDEAMADIELKRIYIKLSPKQPCAVCHRNTRFKLCWLVSDRVNEFVYDCTPICPRCKRLLDKLTEGGPTQ
jgi:hypothetical protein